MIAIPGGVIAMAGRGLPWADWVRALPAAVAALAQQWELCVDGEPTHGNCSLVMPVRTADGVAAMLKVGFPEEDSEHEHLALRRWGGDGAVRLLAADPHRRALLLERAHPRDLSTIPEERACEVVADLYRRLHVPALPTLRSLSSFVTRQGAQLANLPRGAPIPRRLVEQAVTLGGELCSDRSASDRVIHTDLHYANVLAANVLSAEREPWLAIDPKPLNGDPHYELAPMLWNRWEAIAGDVRAGVRRRLGTLVDAAGLDADRARAWVLVRMVHNAMWAVADGPDIDRSWLTVCVAVAKAVAD